MQTLLEYIQKESFFWTQLEKFHNGEIDEYIGTMYGPHVYTEARNIIAGSDMRAWVFSSNVIIKKLNKELRSYIVDNALEYDIIQDKDIEEKPYLLNAYNLDMGRYKRLFESKAFIENYIPYIIDNPSSINVKIFSKIPFEKAWPLLSQYKMAYPYHGLHAILKSYLSSKKFEHEVKPVLLKNLKSSRDTMSDHIRMLFYGKGPVLKNILSAPELVEKIFTPTDFVEALITCTDSFPHEYLDKYEDIWLKNVYRINLKNIRKINKEKIMRFFPKVLCKPQCSLNIAGAKRTKVPYINIEEYQNQVGVFYLHELSVIDKMRVYLQTEKSGLEVMLWVAGDVNEERTVFKKGDKIHYEIAYLESLKSALDIELSEKVGYPIEDWISKRKLEASILGLKPAATSNYILNSFYEDIHGTKPTQELDLMI